MVHAASCRSYYACQPLRGQDLSPPGRNGFGLFNAGKPCYETFNRAENSIHKACPPTETARFMLIPLLTLLSAAAGAALLGSLLFHIRQHASLQRLQAELTRLEKSAQNAREEKNSSMTL